MFRYYLKQALRQIASRKLTSGIQIMGLAIGLGSVILMMTYIIHEYSFDKYHKNSKRTYRVVYDIDCSTPYVMGDAFAEEIPEIENVFRIYSLSNTLIKFNDEMIREENFILVDSSIFSVLDVPLLSGNKYRLFQNKNALVISEQSVRKYFGEKDPLGLPLEVIISGKKVICQVSGVFKKFPSYSSFQPDFLGNIELIDYAIADQSLMFTSGSAEEEIKALNDWDQKGFQTFVMTKMNADVALIEKKATLICQRHDKENKSKPVHLQQLSDMYFHSQDLWNYLPLNVSNVKTIRLFEGVALLILLVALFNFILLSTAETKSQLKEIACRKVLGASTRIIAKNVYLNSLLIVIFSLVPAFIFIQLTIPVFNSLFEKSIHINLLTEPQYLVAVIGIALITGLAGGTYLILYSKRLPPVSLFKQQIIKKGNRYITSSGTLIIFQFAIFIFLAGFAILVAKQVRFSENKAPGFISNNVIVFRLNNLELRNKVNVIKTELLSSPHVLGVATSAFTPPHTSFIKLEIGSDKNSEPIKEEALFIGTDLIELLQIPLIDGDSFKENTDNPGHLIINEKAADKYGVKTGDQLGSFVIRGVLKDFHVHSVHRSIEPLFLLKMNDEGCYELALRSDGHDSEIFQNARKIWADILPTAFFEYEILNDRIASFYVKERNQEKTLVFFALLAVFLSVTGLFGFVAITLIKRTKEIGIRKVNGARAIEVMIMLNGEFVKWVFVAFVIACPVSWYAMQKWLQGFAYKTTLSWWVFAVAGAIAVAVALLTVSWQSWRAANKNPVEALRYE